MPGAYVYFTFLRPFAEAAGVELDWTVPRDSLDLYPFISMIEGGAQTVEQDPATLLPADPMIPSRADEAAHAPGPGTWWSDAWHLDAATSDGVGLSLRLECYPNQKTAWFWTYLVLPTLTGPVVRARPRGPPPAARTRSARRGPVVRALVRDAARTLDVRARGVRGQPGGTG